MSLLTPLRRRSGRTPGARPAEASPAGAPAERAATSLAERAVAAASGLLSGRHSRRRFLTRAAVVGSALAVNPFDFILKPGTAYGYICGSCTDGWTAFCCTINGGKNSCPPNSFVAGWWKADNAAYCCGSARYIIDCNATCPTQCSCRCTGASCDGRKTCCNQFRYGQCNQQIACFGPVVCRVALCITPWAYDRSCSTFTLTSNATVDHGSPCLNQECDSAITRKYYAFGGPESLLGNLRQTERQTPDRRGRYAVYQGGRIYWSSASGAREIHGSVYDVWAAAGTTSGAYGFPTSDVVTSGDGRARYSRFQKGGIYRWSAGTFGVPEPYYALWSKVGGALPNSALGLPKSGFKRTGDRRALYIDFERGRMYRRGELLTEIHGALFDKHEQLGGVAGPLGHVQTSVGTLLDGKGRACIFERGGVIYFKGGLGAAGLWGPVLSAYLAYGGYTSDVGYPVTDRADVGDGRGQSARCERGGIYHSPTTGGRVVPKALHDQYLAQGGPTGSLGYPTANVVRGAGGALSQTFEGGTLTSP